MYHLPMKPAVGGIPPSESSVLRGVGQEGKLFKLLTVDHGMKGILEVALPEAAGGHGVCVIRMARGRNTLTIRV